MKKTVIEPKLPTFPKYITAKHPSQTLDVFQQIKELSYESSLVKVSAEQLRFVDPFGLCLLSAFCGKLRESGVELELCGLNHNLLSYFSRMDLFSHCCAGQEPIPHIRTDLRSKLLEVKCLNHAREVADTASDLSASIIGSTPGYDANSVPHPMTGSKPHDLLEENLLYIFNELLENSLTHAKLRGYDSGKVWVSSQYYEESDKVRVAIVDTGCGFLNSLHNHHESPSNDEEAIYLALKPRISCNRDVGLTADSVNQGIGLTAVTMMVKQSEGNMSLMSGETIVRSFGQADGYISNRLTGDRWQGVGITIEMERKKLQDHSLAEQAIGSLRVSISNPDDENLIQFI